MPRYIVISMIFGFVTLVTSLPRDIDSLGDDTFDIDINSNLQSTNRVQENTDWQNIFQVHNSTELYNQIEVEKLFSYSNFTDARSLDPVANVIRFSAGKRIPNDLLVASRADSQNWIKPMNVHVILKYPTRGQGKKITYIEMVVDHTSKTGGPKIVKGGIGKHQIVIIVEAHNTYWLKYNVNIYGI